MNHVDCAEPASAEHCAALQEFDPSDFTMFKKYDYSRSDRAIWSNKNSSDNSNRISLTTGDILTQTGGKLTFEMPSGETLTIDGKNWTLRDSQGNELARKEDQLRTKNPADCVSGGKLDNGAYVDRVIPFRGPDMWTINYPNGDRIAIREGKVAITRGNNHTEYGVSGGQTCRKRVEW